MSLGQVLALLLIVGCVVALIVFRTWSDRRRQRKERITPERNRVPGPGTHGGGTGR